MYEFKKTRAEKAGVAVAAVVAALFMLAPVVIFPEFFLANLVFGVAVGALYWVANKLDGDR